MASTRPCPRCGRHRDLTAFSGPKSVCALCRHQALLASSPDDARLEGVVRKLATRYGEDADEAVAVARRRATVVREQRKPAQRRSNAKRKQARDYERELKDRAARIRTLERRVRDLESQDRVSGSRWTATFHRKNHVILAQSRKVARLKTERRALTRRAQTLQAQLDRKQARLAAVRDELAAVSASLDKLRAERAAAPADVSGGQRIHDPLAGAGGQRPRLPHGEFEPIGDACFTSFFHDEEVV